MTGDHHVKNYHEVVVSGGMPQPVGGDVESAGHGRPPAGVAECSDSDVRVLDVDAVGGGDGGTETIVGLPSLFEADVHAHTGGVHGYHRVQHDRCDFRDDGAGMVVVEMRSRMQDVHCLQPMPYT